MTAAAFTPQAEAEGAEAVDWIRRDNPAAARVLRDAIVNAAERIGMHPHLGVARADLAREPYRFLTLTGFPYVVVYNSERRPPLIVRIVHGARDLPEALRDL